MSRHTQVRSFLFLVALLGAALPCVPAEPGGLGEQDLTPLLEGARQSFDLDHEDAVLLFDRTYEAWTADGRRISSVHRLAYILTDHAVHACADLRVPYDGTRQRMTVTALRTYRLSDRRWVASGATAQVETLPFAADRAPDYGHRREMMLLHDGVELPCVLETAYTLEDREPFRPGADGLWTLAREEPSLRSELVLAFPAGDASRVASPVDAQPGRDEALGLDTLTFTVGPIAALPRPCTAATAVSVPHVVWSTWPTWEALGRDLERALGPALVVDDPLLARSRERLRDAHTPADTVRLVAGLVADDTRPVAPLDRGWWEARAAGRTWATAYGDRLDRALLAVALIREAGLTATLAYRGLAYGALAGSVATTTLLDGPAVWVSGDGVEGWLDPAADQSAPGLAVAFGRAVWRPGLDPEPVLAGSGPSRLVLRLDLGWQAEAKQWKGTAVLTATGALSPFARMAGLGEETRKYLESLASKVLAGAVVTVHNLEVFGPDTVVAGFALELPAGDRDPLGRLRLSVGEPEELGALLAQADVRTAETDRTSPVSLPGPLEQRVELHLELGGLEPVYLPQERQLANPAGQAELAVTREGDRVAVVRTLRLTGLSYEPARWPELRALLLADAHDRGRLVMLK